MVSRECKLCGQKTNNGIHILGIHICKKCEKDIAQINQGHIKYEYFKILLKRAWRNHTIRVNQG